MALSVSTMTDKPWHDEQKVRRMYEQEGLTINEIADELGCTLGTMSYCFQKFGIDTSDHRKTDAGYTDKETLRRLFYEEGMTRQEIADKYDVTYRAINRWLRRHDLQPENPTLTYGYMCVTGNGYEQFVDYTNSYTEDRVQLHRLLAVAKYGIEAVKGKHVHHRNRISWDNRPSNIEVMTPSKHIRHHRTTENG